MGYTCNLAGEIVGEDGKPVERRKDGKEHSCIPISDEEYKELFKTSLNKFYQSNWTEEEHKVWCDESNFGVTHFGIDAELFDVSSIRFDTFHMMCSIIKQVMSVVRDFVLEQTPDVYERFGTDVLGTFYNEYLINIWNNKMQFSGFQGKECSSFVKNVDLIVNWLKLNFIQCNKTHNIIKLLHLVEKIDAFVRITYIEQSEEEYKK